MESDSSGTINLMWEKEYSRGGNWTEAAKSWKWETDEEGSLNSPVKKTNKKLVQIINETEVARRVRYCNVYQRLRDIQTKFCNAWFPALRQYFLCTFSRFYGSLFSC